MAQPATVLILADIGDPERVAVESACAAAGFTPVVEPSAEAATGKLTAKRFDALVVHLGTPGAALACMRARGKLLRTRIPVVALVDGDDEPAFSRAYRAGADEVLLLEKPQWLTTRLRALPRSTIPQPGNARGDAVVADADRTRAEVIERVLRDAGFRVEVAIDGFSTRLQVGRPSLKVAVVDASLDDVPSLIAQAKTKGARCAWVVRARPEQLKELEEKLAKIERVALVSAYGPPEDVLFETNRLLEARSTEGRTDVRLLHGSILRLLWSATGAEDIGYSYNISASGIYVRTLVAPVGQDVSVEIFPPDGDEKIRLECEVVWRREFGMTRKEPVPSGFALKIVGGQISAWSRVCSVRASLMPRPSVTPRAEPSLPARVAAPAAVEIRPREESSVEEMLASVLKETEPDDEAAGSAPLSIDGDSVVELHAAAAAPSPDEVTKVHDTASLQSPPHTMPYATEGALTDLLAEASDATKTPLAVPRALERLARETKGTPAAKPVERPADSLPPRPAPRADAKAVGLAATMLAPPAEKTPESHPTSPGSQPKGAPASARNGQPKKPASVPPPAKPASVPPPKPASVPPPKPEVRVDATSTAEPTTLDVTDITPASLGFDLSEDGRIIEAVSYMPPVAERNPEAPKGPGATGPRAAIPSRPPALSIPSVKQTNPLGTPVPTVAPEWVKRAEATTRVVADPDAEPTGETMRPSGAGISERPSPVPAMAPVRVPSFGAAAKTAGAVRTELPDDDFAPPKRRTSPVLWVAIAVVIGGAAALVVSPSLRQLSGGPAATPPVAAPPVVPAATPSAVENLEALGEHPVAARAEPTGAPAAKASAEAARAEPARPAESAAPTSPATAPAAGSAELDDAALRALEPGKGYLFVSSPLATNVYVYGNLAGTTNQRIATKCGPRFIRLGTERGLWQGEGQVQIVKCGALTRVEMAGK